MKTRRQLASVLGGLLAAAALIGCGGYGPPTDPASQLEFGTDMARLDLWSEAYFRFDRVVKGDPGNARAWNNLAVASEAMGRFDEARERYQRALELDPGNREIRRNHDRFESFYVAYRAEQEGDGSPTTPDRGEDAP